jgi:(E)-4-hydroxy-3-methylbut-2-enyl-diphosphate synthase
MKRKVTRKVWVGNIALGGDAPIPVQSMTTTDPRDIGATIEQIRQLEDANCDIVRIAVFDEECAKSVKTIKEHVNIPLVADIHFDYRLAIAAVKNGIDKLRINPGNIGNEDKVREVVSAAKDRKIPIRIGVNSGSLKKEFMHKYGNSSIAMAESALEEVSILEKYGFEDIVISLKASSVEKTVEAYRYVSQRVDYPLHLGITEAGTQWSGTIKSSIGIGALLLEGVGDTLRVSLTAHPVEEVKVGIEILKCLGLRREGIEIISCPTCGRCNIDLFSIVKRVEQQIRNVKEPLKVAVMGCVVNGPGEAREADIGIAGGRGQVVLFKKGNVIGTYPEDKAVDVLVSEIRRITENESSCNHTRIQ